MEIDNIALLVKKYIDTLKKTDSKPGVSFIEERALSVQPLRQLIETELKTTNEKIKLFYIVFFLFQGDSMEVAKYKANNELYYLILQEIGDKEYVEEECEYCEGNGYIECNSCYNGNEECYSCGGTGEVDYRDYDGQDNECEECRGTGEVECSDCEGNGESECEECYGTGQVSSDDEYVYLNTEYWVFYGDEIEQKFSEHTYDEPFEAYEILDEIKGSVTLLRTESETEKIEMIDFQRDFGFYDEIKGMNVVHSLYNLNDFDLTPAFKVQKFSKSYVIR